MSGSTHPVVVLGHAFPRDNVLFFQYDDNSPVRLVLPPSGTKGTLTKLHQQLGHAGQDKMEKAARKIFWMYDKMYGKMYDKP